MPFVKNDQVETVEKTEDINNDNLKEDAEAMVQRGRVTGKTQHFTDGEAETDTNNDNLES